MTVTRAGKTERLEARVPADVKALLQHAADLTGRSLSDFVLAAAYEAAEETIRTHEVIRLSAEDSLQFAEAILNPPPPNDRLVALFDEYRAFTKPKP